MTKMADDALTRKEAEMGRLTREWLLEERKFWADQVKTNTTLDVGIRLRVKTCDLALRALSLESVREEAARVCDEIAAEYDEIGDNGNDFAEGAMQCATAIRALQHAPARVAEGGREGFYEKLWEDFLTRQAKEQPKMSQVDDDVAEVGQVLEMCRSMLKDIVRRTPGVKTFVDSEAFILNEINPALVKLEKAAHLMRAKEQPGEQNARRVKCPDCPDGQLWDKDGPTSDACLTCGGTAFIWLTPPPPERP